MCLAGKPASTMPDHCSTPMFGEVSSLSRIAHIVWDRIIISFCYESWHFAMMGRPMVNVLHPNVPMVVEAVLIRLSSSLPMWQNVLIGRLSELSES